MRIKREFKRNSNFDETKHAKKVDSNYVHEERKRVDSFKTGRKLTIRKLIWKNKHTKRNTIFSNDDDYNNFENNHNQYHYQYRRPNRYEYLHLKLNDLINPDRNKTFIDNLYAQFQPDSKQINLIYSESKLHRMNQMPDNLVLLSNSLLDSKNYSVLLNNNNKQIDANKLLNEYYLNVLKKTSDYDSVPMPKLLTSEIFLIIFVLSLWFLSVLICFKRFSLILNFNKKDVPYYNSNLVNVSARLSLHEKKDEAHHQQQQQQQQHQQIQQDLITNSSTTFNVCKCTSVNELNEIQSHTNSNSILNNYQIYSNGNNNNQNNFDTSNGNLDEKQPSQMNRQRQVKSDFFCSKCNGIQKHCFTYKSVSNGNFNLIKLSNFSDKTSKTSCSLKNKSSNIHSKPNLNQKGLYSQAVDSENKFEINKSPKMRNFMGKDKTSKHFNLMSLDDTALHLYREHHKNTIDEKKKYKNVAIPLYNLIEYQPSNSPSPSIKANSLVVSNKIDTKSRLSPHVNFLSLHSGSDSAQSCFLKPGNSYECENYDPNDLLFSSSSSQHSQAVQSNSIQTRSPSSSLNTKLNNPSIAFIRNTNKNFLINNQRPINPLSSMRRHMFVNSRRNAQTTVDSKNNEDSLNIEHSYDLVHSLSTNSTNQVLAPIYSTSFEPNDEFFNLSNNIKPKSSTNDQKLDEINETIESTTNLNLINPHSIPAIIRETLLEMHERAKLSKSDSGFIHRSSNVLLHSPASRISYSTKKKALRQQKKTMSLQGSEEKVPFNSLNQNDTDRLNNTTSTNTNANANNSSAIGNTNSSYINNFYEELRSKIFQYKMNKSISSNTNTISTNISTIQKHDSKQQSVESKLNILGEKELSEDCDSR